MNGKYSKIETELLEKLLENNCIKNSLEDISNSKRKMMAFSGENLISKRGRKPKTICENNSEANVIDIQ